MTPGSHVAVIAVVTTSRAAARRGTLDGKGLPQTHQRETVEVASARRCDVPWLPPITRPTGRDHLTPNAGYAATRGVTADG